ncbi:MAG: fibronectin type III domain-containing protein [Solirubrobacteraceae bacterium]
MSVLVRLPLRRRVPRIAVLLAALGAASLALLTAVASGDASGTTVTVTCSADNPGGTTTTTVSGVTDLQSALDASGPSGDNTGGTVIVDGLCSGTFLLPYHAAFTLAGETGTTSGFDGQNGDFGEGPGTLLTGWSVGAMTISNLLFEGGTSAPSGASETSGVSDGSRHSHSPQALNLHQYESGTSIALTGDTFEQNTSYQESPVSIVEDAGGSECESDEGSLAISDSTFEDNTENLYWDDEFEGGAGLSVTIGCYEDPVTLTGNTFSDNTLVDQGADYATGGGLSISCRDCYEASQDNFATDIASSTQSGNVFAGNAVSAPDESSKPPCEVGGAGEWAYDVNVTSTGDGFFSNALPGTPDYDGGSCEDSWSWGGGLAEANDVAAGANTLTDDVLAANTISDSSTDGDSNGDVTSDGDDPGNAQGAAIYLGIETCDLDSCQNALTLNDSTLTANSVTSDGTPDTTGEATAGIWGNPDDSLTLANTILYGDVGGSETSGFDDGGSLTANYSDFCDGTSPYAGTGNICADPLLVDNGSLTSSDVHETASSPTIDAGSNALVPAGLTTDFYGALRELNGTILECPNPGGIVDIGAAEYARSCTVPGPPLDVTASPSGDPSALISFNPPASDGGSTIEYYTVTAQPGDETATGPASPIVVPGLQYGVAYTFSVTATNAVGTGPPGSVSTALTLSQPAAPSQLSTTACVSRRDFLMHPRIDFNLKPDELITEIKATFGTRHVYETGKNLKTVRIDLRGLAQGAYPVHVTVREPNGNVLRLEHIFHTCAPVAIHWHHKKHK